MYISRYLCLVLLLSSLWGCTQRGTSGASSSSPDFSGEGTLLLQANGEDFIRQGFVTKDGWQLQFDHAYVHLAEVTAYQAPPDDQPDGDTALNTQKTEVMLVSSQTVDLAEGDENAEPIAVAEQVVPAGRYDALSWKMTKAEEGPAADRVIVLVGTATKGEKALDFTLQFDRTTAYACGDYIGDERKGILESNSTAKLEATFHFDHLFGDGSAPPEDDINTGALGFEPLAVLAEGNTVMLEQSMLETRLSPEDYTTLTTALEGMAHVGEGHCESVDLES